MDSELGKKGQAIRNLNFSKIDNLFIPKYTVKKRAEIFRPEIPAPMPLPNKMENPTLKKVII